MSFRLQPAVVRVDTVPLLPNEISPVSAAALGSPPAGRAGTDTSEDGGIAVSITLPSHASPRSYGACDASSSSTLRVMTFNLWAVPFASAHTDSRIDALLTRLSSDLSLDVLGLQEAFTPIALAALRSRLPAAGLPHIMAFTSGGDLPSGAHGSGCVVASRFPIADTAWHTFTGGRPFRLDQWDFQSGKGIGLTRLKLPQGLGTVDVYVSHLQAQYGDAAGDAYAAQRALQAFECAAFIRATRRSDLTILLADLNAGPASDVYALLTRLCGLQDAYSSCAAPPVARSIQDATFGGIDNTFSYLYHTKGAGSSSACCRARPPTCDINVRLDYVLIGTGGDGWPASRAGRAWRVRQSDIRLREHVALPSGQRISYSDHAAVYAELECCAVPEVGAGEAETEVDAARAAAATQWVEVLSECKSTMKTGWLAARTLRSAQITRCVIGALLAGGLLAVGCLFSRNAWSPISGVVQGAVVLICITLAFISLFELRTRWHVLTLLVLFLGGSAGAIAASVVVGDWPAILIGLGEGLLSLALLNFWVATMMTSAEARAFERVAAQVDILMQRAPSVVG